MNARYLTDCPIDGYAHTRRNERVALQRDRLNLGPLFEALGWVLAGATVGSVAVMVGAWGLLQLIEPAHSAAPVSTALAYQAPAPLPQ
jgi:hypothetical protein